MKSGLIRYNLFKTRKKFNPLSLFNANKNLTYEDFVNFLHSRNVEPPSVDYFNKVKSAFDLESKTKETTVKENQAENVVDEIEKVKDDEQTQIKEPVKTKSKRKKKNEKPVDNKTDTAEWIISLRKTLRIWYN